MSENSKKNIVWLVDHLGYGGIMHGAGKYYLNTIPALDSGKFNVILLVLREKDHLTRYFEDKGIDVRHLGRGKFDLMTFWDVLKVAKEESIDLIHAHGYGSSNFGRMVRIFQKTAVIVHAHDDDRNYPLHQKLADRMLGQYCDRALSVSESVKMSAVNKRKIREDNVFVIHNGIPLQDFIDPGEVRVQKERARIGVKGNFRVVGTVTKLREEKGTRYLIESAASVLEAFPQTLFLIAGDGPLKEELKNLARRLEIADRVIFAGFCDDIPSVLSIIDIVAIPSLTEGSPLALLEAMAMGKPIVATNVGGMKEILRDGETGLLVPSRDPAAMAERIMNLFNDPGKAKDLGTNAKEESQKYDTGVHATTLEDHYTHLLRTTT